MKIKERIINAIENWKRARIDAKYNKYLAFAKIASGEKYKKDAESIIVDAKKLENDVAEGKLASRLVYDEQYYLLSVRIQKLYDIKHDEHMKYIDLVQERELNKERQDTLSTTHAEVSKYLSDNLYRAMTAVRNCEYARLRKESNVKLK